MDAIRHKPGKGSAAKPAAKKSAPGTPGASRARLAARITAERRAVAEMAAKIRERSKEMAAGADRLLSRVLVASPSIDDLLVAMQAVTELQRAVYTMQDSIAKHTKVLDHLIDGFNLMDQRLKELENERCRATSGYQ